MSNKFTMVELLVVISIIVILAAMTLAASGYMMNRAAESRTLAQITTLEMACQQFKTHNGYLPTGDNEVDLAELKTMVKPNGDLLYQPENVEKGADDANTFALDGWDEPLFWDSPVPDVASETGPNKGFVRIWSKGKDNCHGNGGSIQKDAFTHDENDDVTNWKR